MAARKLTSPLPRVPELSIVIPLFNEAEVIPDLLQSLTRLARQLPAATELILVDDGSSDMTLETLKNARQPWQCHIISLSRNFGHQAALFVGLRAAKGRIIVTMDGDLQHPPELILDMLKLHHQGYDIVLTERTDTDRVPWLKRVASQSFYTLINLMSETRITINGSDFRSMNRTALDALLSLPEGRKFLRGMVGWIGFKTIILPFQAPARMVGESKYTWHKMWSLAFSGVTAFTAVPLQLASFFSVGLFIAALVYAVYVLYVKLVVGDVVSGWASVTFVLLVVGGFLSLFIGLVGVYLAAIYEEIKARPVALIREEIAKDKKI